MARNFQKETAASKKLTEAIKAIAASFAAGGSGTGAVAPPLAAQANLANRGTFNLGGGMPPMPEIPQHIRDAVELGYNRNSTAMPLFSGRDPTGLAWRMRQLGGGGDDTGSYGGGAPGAYGGVGGGRPPVDPAEATAALEKAMADFSKRQPYSLPDGRSAIDILPGGGPDINAYGALGKAQQDMLRAGINPGRMPTARGTQYTAEDIAAENASRARGREIANQRHADFTKTRLAKRQLRKDLEGMDALQAEVARINRAKMGAVGIDVANPQVAEGGLTDDLVRMAMVDPAAAALLQRQQAAEEQKRQFDADLAFKNRALDTGMSKEDRDKADARWAAAHQQASEYYSGPEYVALPANERKRLVEKMRDEIISTMPGASAPGAAPAGGGLLDLLKTVGNAILGGGQQQQAQPNAMPMAGGGNVPMPEYDPGEFAQYGADGFQDFLAQDPRALSMPVEQMQELANRKGWDWNEANTYAGDMDATGLFGSLVGGLGALFNHPTMTNADVERRKALSRKLAGYEGTYATTPGDMLYQMFLGRPWVPEEPARLNPDAAAQNLLPPSYAPTGSGPPVPASQRKRKKKRKAKR